MLFTFHAFAKSPSFSVDWMQVNCACRVPNASGGFPHGLSFLPAKIWQLWVTLMIIAPEASLTKMLFFPVSPHSRAHALRLSARTDGTKKISVFGCWFFGKKKKKKNLWQVKEWVEMSVETTGERIFFNSSKYIIFNLKWFESTLDCCGFFCFYIWMTVSFSLVCIILLFDV